MIWVKNHIQTLFISQYILINQLLFNHSCKTRMHARMQSSKYIRQQRAVIKRFVK